MGIFAFLFLILPLIILFVLAILAVKGVSFILRLFGLSSDRYRSAYGDDARQGSRRQSYNTGQTTTSSEKSPNKIIGDDEGEYVDFEEVK